MKKKIIPALFVATLLAACNNSVDDAQIHQDVHRIVAKTEQCYANVHDDLIDSLDVEFFGKCTDELEEMIDDIYKKYRKENDRRKFDSIFMAEIQNSNIDNDYISLMQEIYELKIEN